MQNFEYYSPTKVIFGKGAEEHVGEEIKKLNVKKVLVHFGGQSARKSGLIDKVEKLLEEASIQYVTLGGVVPNPRLSLVRKGIELCAKEGVDFILAVGGGSVIDSSKAIAYGLANRDVDVWDLYIRKAQVKGCLPVGAILTISAAGSETSNSSVITNEDGNIKRGLGSDLARPKFAIMNPELTYSLPIYQVTCGIVDIMMHTLDRYFTCSKGNEMTDSIAEALLRVAIKNGKIAFKDKTDYDAMSELMWAGSLSHNNLTGLGAAGDFSTHQLGHELSGMFDVAHGASLSAVWGSWARYVYKENISRFAQYARNVWNINDGTEEEIALAGIKATEDYFKSLNMPISITELECGKLSEDVLEELAYRCSFKETREIGSFKKLNKADMLKIYAAANQ
jgi:alcohol dehydrogenase YqhD (iron-dependent ADH family)